MNLPLDFVVADMQRLEPISDGQIDIVFATYPCWIQDLAEACRNWFRVLAPGGRLLMNMEHPIAECLSEDKAGIHVTRDYNHPMPRREEIFDGTGLADRFGGFQVDLPSVLHFYRVSDILNAICKAGFRIEDTHESFNSAEKYEKSDLGHPPESRWLPSELTILAQKP